MIRQKLSILAYSLASGGAERVVSLLLPGFQKEFDVTLVLMNDTIEYTIPENTKIVYLENSLADESPILKLIKLPVLGWKYKSICKKEKIDISFSLMNRPNYINLFAKIFGNKVKTIISDRTAPSFEYAQVNVSSWMNMFLIRTLFDKADRIITNSFGCARDLHDNFAISQEIDTIHNPVDVVQISYKMQESVDMDKNKFIFITVGRLDYGKNHSLLIQAFALLENEKMQLLIIGEGPQRESLLQQIQALKLEGKVILLGRKTNPFAYLRQADCFVFASLHEGFPNVLLEALACGLPIVSADCFYGPREILSNTESSSHLSAGVEHAEYGVLVAQNSVESMADAMKSIYFDTKLRELYAEKSHLRIQQFELDRITQEFIKVLSR